MWMTLISFIGGPVIKGLIDAYQAKLKAGNVESKIAADLAAGESRRRRLRRRRSCNIALPRSAMPSSPTN